MPPQGLAPPYQGPPYPRPPGQNITQLPRSYLLPFRALNVPQVVSQFFERENMQGCICWARQTSVPFPSRTGDALKVLQAKCTKNKTDIGLHMQLPPRGAPQPQWAPRFPGPPPAMPPPGAPPPGARLPSASPPGPNAPGAPPQGARPPPMGWRPPPPAAAKLRPCARRCLVSA